MERDKFPEAKYLNPLDRFPSISSFSSQYELEIVKRIVSMEKKIDLILKKLEELETELKKKGIL